MKKILLACLVSLLFAGAAQAASVSGVAYSTSTCGPLAGQKVYLSDTLSTLVDSAITSSTGAYSLTFPSSWSAGKSYLITAYSCGAVWNTHGIYTGSSVTLNHYVCGTQKVFWGTVMLGSTPNSGPAKVYLISVRKNYPIAGDTTLTAIDSVTINGTGTYSFVRPCAPTDTMLVKAALMPAHTSYASYLPSYDSSLVWSAANRFYSYHFTSGFSGSGHNIYMFSGSNSGGPGFIGGSVLVGANKQAGVGDPLSGRLLILTNSATNAPVAYTYSDAIGKFSFPSVANGTYKLFGDAWGLFNPALTVTVDNTHQTVNNIIFEENYGENSFKGRYGTVGVGVVGALADVSVYPNPVTTSIAVKGLSQIKGSKTVALYDMVGALVTSRTFTDGQAVEMNVSQLPAGAYMLQLTTEVGSASFKVTK